MVGELPRALDISGQWISITIQQNMKSSHNFEFREAVQFIYVSVLWGKFFVNSSSEGKP